MQERFKFLMNGKDWWQFLIYAVVSFSIMWVIFKYIVFMSAVDGKSMQPTFDGGEKIFVSRTSDVKRCDVIVFRPPGPKGELKDEDYAKMNLLQRAYHSLPFVSKSRFFIKRILATAGDTIAVQDGKVVVNGKAQDDSYARLGIRYWNLDAVVVPEGHVFVMGDNRDHSTDSRDPSLGFIPVDRVEGKAVFVFGPMVSFTDQWPFVQVPGTEKLGSLPDNCGAI